ncbi:hypothetical protein BDV29DRAFT_85661 [Aspergillus leporis]|uniref:Uncharacterized protein n=1 Tax=Aspergillus leporis TaxID=41062 RepID=A0A5N5WIK2_9EURO|nr:hypothetical protein BDV29DRAFT_85661 [Aspergillus leporis]
MSMSDPSVIFHQGLRCTKVPRRPAAVASPSANLSALISSSKIPIPSDRLILSTDPTPVVEGLPLNDPITLSTSHVAASEPTAEVPGTIPSHALAVSILTPATTTTAVSVSSISLTEGNPKTNSLMSSYDSGYSTLETVTSSLFIPLSSSKSLEAFVTRTSRVNAHSTAISSATGDITPNNDSNRDLSHPSADNRADASLRTLLGSILGAMAFIALMFLICLLFFRYKKRKSGGDRSFGGNEKLLRTGRHSADSSTGLQHGYVSGGSVRSNDSSIRSHCNYAPETWINHYYPNHHDRASACYSDPFSDSAALQGESRNNIPRMECTTQALSRDPRYDQKPTVSRTSLPQRTVSDSFLPTLHRGGRQSGSPLGPDEGSIYSSDRSLGSTLILPGRSSLGSSLQRFSYRVSVAELEPFNASDALTKISPRSTRSDPFDLEVPAKVIHPSGSVTQPRSQV